MLFFLCQGRQERAGTKQGCPKVKRGTVNPALVASVAQVIQGAFLSVQTFDN